MNKGFSAVWLAVLFLLILIGFLIFLAIYSLIGPEKNELDEINTEDASERQVGFLKKIKEIENGLKKSEKIPEEISLTKDQISAVVELYCPDDNYEKNSFVNIGSGSIITSDGIILTNKHVVSNKDSSVIRSSPTCYVGITEDISKPVNFKYVADVLAVSPSSDGVFSFDVAVLKIKLCQNCSNSPAVLPENFPYLKIGNSDSLFPGDKISIVGYPGIGSGTWNFTSGIISGKLGEFIYKTDAKIDAGNSGGAALDSENRLVGIPAWVVSGSAESIGYIIGIDEIYEWFSGSVLPGL